MSRKKKPTDPEIMRRLIAVKMMLAGMGKMLPNARAEVTREACETLDELIEELA